MDLIKVIEQEQMKADLPDIKIGDLSKCTLKLRKEP